MRRIKKFLRDEEGATAVEYGIMVAAIAAVIGCEQRLELILFSPGPPRLDLVVTSSALDRGGDVRLRAGYPRGVWGPWITGI
jgi:hypothetical protein